MKRVIYLLIVFLFLAACSTTNSSEISEVKNELRVKNNKLVELEKEIAQNEKTIKKQKKKIKELEKTEDEHNLGYKNEDQKIPTLKVGETFSNDELEITIKQVTNVSDGIKVDFEVHNKSDTPFEGNGGLQFKLDNEQNEDEFNTLGYTIGFNNIGWIYPGEKSSGYYQYLYDREVNVKEIHYYIQVSGTNTRLIGKWIVE